MKRDVFQCLCFISIFSLSIINTGCQSGTSDKSNSDSTKKPVTVIKKKINHPMMKWGITGGLPGNNATVQFGIKTSPVAGDDCNPGPSLCSAAAGASGTPKKGSSTEIVLFRNLSGNMPVLTFNPSLLTADLQSYFQAFLNAPMQGGIYTSQGNCTLDPSLVSLWGLTGTITENPGLPIFVNPVSDTQCFNIYKGLIPGHSGSITVGNPSSNCDATGAGVCTITAYTNTSEFPVMIDTNNMAGTTWVSLTFNLSNMITKQPGLAQFFSLDTVNYTQTAITLSQDYTFTEPVNNTGIPTGWVLTAGTDSIQAWPTIIWGTTQQIFSGWITLTFLNVNTNPGAGIVKPKNEMKGKKK